MLVGFHKDHGCGRHQGLQQRIIFIGPAHVLDAAQLSRLFLREPGAFPDGNLFICLTQQQNLIPAALPDGHDQDGFFLVNSRKIKEVGILMQGKSAVRIRRKYVVGVQNQHTAGRQAGSKFFTVAGKKEEGSGSYLISTACPAFPACQSCIRTRGNLARLLVVRSSSDRAVSPLRPILMRLSISCRPATRPFIMHTVEGSTEPPRNFRSHPLRKNSRSQSGHESNTTRADAVLSCMHGAIPRLFLALGTGLVFPVPVPGQCPFPL